MRALKAAALVVVGLAFVAQFAYAQVYAQVGRAPPMPTSPEIIHVNGVWSSEKDSIANTTALEAVLKSHGFSVDDYGVSLVHNPFNFKWPTYATADIGDLGEVGVQLRLSNEALAAAAAGGRSSDYLPLLGESYNRLYLNQAGLTAQERRVVKMAEFLKRVIRSRIEAGRRFVIVVPHSQGNLYAEAAYAMLLRDDRKDVIGRTLVVGVAVPANRTPNGSYVTNSKDKVVAGAGRFLREPLPSNVTPCWPSASFCGSEISLLGSLRGPDVSFHTFIPAYLSELVTSAERQESFASIVVKLISNAAAELTVRTAPPSVSSAPTCTNPIVGQPMTCTFVGSNLGDATAMSATNCSPASMAVVAGGTTFRRQFTCTPQAAGAVDLVYAVPGIAPGSLPAIPRLNAVLPPTVGTAVVAPSLVAPLANVVVSSLTPTLTWSGGSAGFWQVNIRNLLTNVLLAPVNLATSQLTYTVPAGLLLANTPYRWDVTACPDAICNDAATYRLSVDGYFTTPASPAPTVAAIVCPSPVAGQPMSCALTGSNLSAANVGARSQLCGANPAMALVAASATQASFSCPSAVAGRLPVEAYRIDTNAVLLTQTVLVPTPPPPVPTVSGIDCGAPVAGQVMTCRVSGASLTSANVTLSTPVCPTVGVQAPGTAALQTFTCTTNANLSTAFATSTVSAKRADNAAVLRSVSIRLAPTPQPELHAVTAIGCSNAILNQTMTCTLSGTGLTDTNYLVAVVDAVDQTQSCSNLVVNAGTGSRQRTFTCIPTRASRQDVRIFPSQGAGLLNAAFVSVQPVAMPERFREDFSSPTLNPAVWLNYGSPVTLAGGLGTFGAASVATTMGRFNVVGDTLVVEARFSGSRPSTATTGRDSYVSLVDAYTGDTISFGDASYQRDGNPVGMYLTGAGTFGLRQSGNGVSTSAYKEYRLTISGSTVLLERGDTLANITERLAFVLRVPAAGRPFYLRIGTGSADFAPSNFDWVSIRSDRSDLPGPIATFFSTAEGIWLGTLAGGTRNAQAFVLDTGAYWILYNNSNNSDFGGFLQGTDTSAGGAFSAFNSKDASIEAVASVTDRWVTGTYVPKQSLSGQILNPATAVADQFAMTNYLPLYETPADLGVVAGAFSGTATVVGLPSEVATMNVSATGRLTGATAAGCGFDGYAVPRPKGNLFDVTLTFQGGSCLSGTATVTGIGYYEAATRRLYGMAANSARTGAFLFTGSK